MTITTAKILPYVIHVLYSKDDHSKMTKLVYNNNCLILQIEAVHGLHVKPKY